SFLSFKTLIRWRHHRSIGCRPTWTLPDFPDIQSGYDKLIEAVTQKFNLKFLAPVVKP
ncbi:hypothetical protein BgiBS90_002428, partial [Biomphalaria glabrata]